MTATGQRDTPQRLRPPEDKSVTVYCQGTRKSGPHQQRLSSPLGLGKYLPEDQWWPPGTPAAREVIWNGDHPEPEPDAIIFYGTLLPSQSYNIANQRLAFTCPCGNRLERKVPELVRELKMLIQQGVAQYNITAMPG